MNLTLLAKVTARAFFSLGKNRRTISLVYFHVYASYLPFLGPSPRPRISFPGGLSVSMPSRSRERSNFSDSPVGRGGIETNVAKDKRRVKDPRNDVRPRLIWHEFPKTSTVFISSFEINLVRLFELWYRLSRQKSTSSSARRRFSLSIRR